MPTVPASSKPRKALPPAAGEVVLSYSETQFPEEPFVMNVLALDQLLGDDDEDRNIGQLAVIS
jgi:hypothetical protein